MQRERKAEAGTARRGQWRLLAPVAVLRATAILAIGAIAFLIALKVAVAGVYAESRPATALAWAPNHAVAQSSAATRLLADNRLDEGRRLALSSLSRSPINVAAIRNLAIAADSQGERASAARLFMLANVVSRRDRPTQIWLIRRDFENGDFDSAIRRFDLAMRTSLRAAEYLAPIVVVATAERRTLPPLSRALAGDPDWRLNVLRALVDAGPNPEHVALLIRGRLDPGVPAERAILQLFLDRLVGEERFDLAWAVFRGTSDGAAIAPSGPRNGGFEHGGGFLPFDWALADEGDLLGVRAARPDGRSGSALSLVARNNRSGPLARQLIALPPGAHRITFVAGAVPAAPADRPRLAINCAQGGQGLGEWRPSNAGEGAQRVAGELRVPPGCRWLWLTISINSGDAGASADPWIDDVAIQARPAAG